MTKLEKAMTNVVFVDIHNMKKSSDMLRPNL